MIRNKIGQFDLNEETWEKRMKGNNAESQMPHWGQYALFCGRAAEFVMSSLSRVQSAGLVVSTYFLLEMKSCVHRPSHVTPSREGKILMSAILYLGLDHVACLDQRNIN